jgi:ribonucleotide monophosphatase NagD (HAD superfamily)
MVGDRPETDLALAADAGWGKILVLSGVTDYDHALPPGLQPDHTIATIADLPGLVTPEDVENKG